MLAARRIILLAFQMQTRRERERLAQLWIDRQTAADRCERGALSFKIFNEGETHQRARVVGCATQHRAVGLTCILVAVTGEKQITGAPLRFEIVGVGGSGGIKCGKCTTRRRGITRHQ